MNANDAVRTRQSETAEQPQSLVTGRPSCWDLATRRAEEDPAFDGNFDLLSIVVNELFVRRRKSTHKSKWKRWLEPESLNTFYLSSWGRNAIFRKATGLRGLVTMYSSETANSILSKKSTLSKNLLHTAYFYKRQFDPLGQALSKHVEKLMYLEVCTWK